MDDLTLEEAAEALGTHIARRLQSTANALVREDIPLSMVSHIMLRLALQGILITEGQKQMHASASELLHELTPKPTMPPKRKKRP